MKTKNVIVAVILSLALVGSCLFGFYVGRAGYVGDLSEQWYTPSQEATYIVGQYNSTHFYMQNHKGYGLAAYDGYEYMSSDASAVINYAIGNLTSGRTSKETVFLKGDFSLANILVPSYTNIIIYANLTKNGNGPIFSLSSVRDVSIDGGYYYGRNGTYSGSGIDIALSSTVTIKNIVMSDVYDYGLDIEHSDNLRILDSDFNACAGDDDVAIHSSTNILVDNCRSFNHTGWIAGAAYSGFEIEDDSRYVTISNCLAWAPNDTTTNRAGFHLHIHAVGESSPSHVTFINDKAVGMGSWGFRVDGHTNGVDLVNGADNRFVDCESDFVQYYGFSMQNAKNITIIGGSATNARHVTQGCGVFVGSNSTNVVVNGLTCSANRVDMKVYDVSDVDTVFEYCDLKSADKIWDDGLRTVIHHCSGYADPYTGLVYTVGGLTNNNAFGTANRTFLCPIEIPFDCYINKLGVSWAATATGNFYVGLYRSASLSPAGCVVVVQSGSTAKSGTYRSQEVSVTESFFKKGLYFLAVESDEAATTILRASNPTLFTGGTFITYYYSLTDYGALSSPCPSVTASTTVISGGWVVISRVP